MNLRKLSILVLAFTLSVPTLAAKKEAGVLACSVLSPIAQGFLAHHIKYKKIDKEIENRTIEQFIKKLDPSKTMLLESDVSAIKSGLSGIFDKLGKDCSSLDKPRQILLSRLSRASEYSKKYLSDSFKFQENTELVIDSTKRNSPKTEKEFESLLEKFIQFQISNYMASDMKLPEAKKQLIHRYELNLKREQDMSQDEYYSLFLDAFAGSLDAHSSYLSQDVLEDFEIQMRLSLEGIGAALTWEDGYTTIDALIPGGSAERNGELQPKDKIIAVAQGDGKPQNVVDMQLRDVVKLIRGPSKSTVKLTVLRTTPKGSEHLVVALQRSKIKLEDEAAKLVMTKVKAGDHERKIAVIELPSFYGDMSKNTRSCYDDLKKLIKKANQEKVEGIVLDLSKNGGGLLSEAVRIGGLFIKTGNIVATQNQKQKLEPLADEDSNVDFKGPLVVLTSRLSASASEIVAGALQDYKRAVIVGGDHTFGKGTVQAMMNLPGDLGAIKVTTGMFFVPGGYSTQHRGVVSDISMPSPFSTNDIGEKTLDYSLPEQKVPAFLSSDADTESTTAPEYWKPVTSDLLSKLRTSSSARVAKNAELKKVTQELEEMEKKKGVIKLADSLKKQKEEKAKDPMKGKVSARNKRRNRTDADYLKEPQVSEAVSVLGDYIEAVDVPLFARPKTAKN